MYTGERLLGRKGEYFIIPKTAPTNHFGFVLSPVDPFHSHPQAACKLCGNECRRDRHHSYWPGPPRTAELARTRAKDPRFNRLPRYKDGTQEGKLRAAVFSISLPICRGFHDALHLLQLPPSDLPDSDIIDLGLHQYKSIETALGRATIALDRSKQRGPGLLTVVQDEEQALSALYANMPREVVFPTVGYYCLVGSDVELDTGLAVPAPVVYPVDDKIIRVSRALTTLRKKLS
jgi:hypothetical protein